MPAEIIELQSKIIHTIADSIGKKWDVVVVNIEIDEIEGEQTENCLAFLFKAQQGKWERTGFELPFECYDLFVALRNSETATEAWKSCTLEFNSSGKYKFSYSREVPRRLNGIHDDQAMLKSYSPQIAL